MTHEPVRQERTVGEDIVWILETLPDPFTNPHLVAHWYKNYSEGAQLVA